MDSVVTGTAGGAGEAGPLVLRRLGTVMEQEPGNPHEIEGVLNPAAARGPDGNLYLFPRLVAAGNYSRIGVARVQFSGDGEPGATPIWISGSFSRRSRRRIGGTRQCPVRPSRRHYDPS